MCPEPPWIAGRLLTVLRSGPAGDRSRERGSSLVEYCLLLALITLVSVGALAAFGTARDAMYERSASSILGP